MDEIFQDVHGFRGAFDVVKVAREKPHRYGKKGELLIDYNDTEAAERRRSSVAGQSPDAIRSANKGYGGADMLGTEKTEDFSEK